MYVPPDYTDDKRTTMSAALLATPGGGGGDASSSSMYSPSPSKKKLSLAKMLAMQQEIALLDRRIIHIKKQIENGITTSNSASPGSLFPPPLCSTPPSTATGVFAVPPSIRVSNSGHGGGTSGMGASQGSFASLDVLGDEDTSQLDSMMVVELCQATASGDVNAVCSLLDNGGDPNCCDYDHRTPLHIAVERGFREIVAILLAHHASPQAVDEDGKTPTMIAEEKGFTDLRDMLMFTGVDAFEPDSFIDSAGSSHETPVATPVANLFSDENSERSDECIVTVMVGLPGRGKTYIAKHIQRYFTWNNYKCGCFTHLSYRKRATGTAASYPQHIPDAEMRTSMLLASEIKEFFRGGGNVAIVDGTHSTPLRRHSLRQFIMDLCKLPPNRVLFVEVFCTDQDQIMQHVLRAREAQRNPSLTFVEDYYENMKQHEQVYRTLSTQHDREVSFIRIENQTTYNLNRIDGWLPSRTAYMLHNLRHSPQPLYLTRSGQYEDMVCGRIGGNSRLTLRGEAYSKALFEFMKQEMGGSPFLVMSSCAARCTQTVHHFVSALLKTGVESVQVPPAPAHLPPPPPMPHHSLDSVSSISDCATPLNDGGIHNNPSFDHLSSSQISDTVRCRVAYFPTLDDLNHGDCEGQLLNDIQRTLPNTMSSMQADPYRVAWPNGESIQQLFTGRLVPHIHEIQASTQPLLIVSHNPLVQGFFAYFVTDQDGKYVAPEAAYKISIPSHSVIRITHRIDRRVAEFFDLEPRVEEILGEWRVNPHRHHHGHHGHHHHHHPHAHHGHSNSQQPHESPTAKVPSRGNSPQPYQAQPPPPAALAHPRGSCIWDLE